MRGRKTWIKGEDHRLYVYPGQLKDDDGNPCYAYYGEDGNIHVTHSLPDIMKRKAFHEQGHKAFDGISYNDRVSIFGEHTEEEYDKKEEALMCFLEGKFYDLLTRTGLLRYPKAPKFPSK